MIGNSNGRNKFIARSERYCRTVIRFACASLLTLALAACSGCTWTDPGEASIDLGEGGSDSERIRLVVWGWAAAVDGLKLNMESFAEVYPHLDVEFQTYQNADLYQKFIVSANANDSVPDIVVLESSNLAQMVHIGALYDLTERVQPYVDKMNKFKWADAMRDERIYAMPWDTGPVVMFYRPHLFEQAGLPSSPDGVASLVRTFADYAQVGATIRDQTDAYLMSDSRNRSNLRFFETMMWQQGLWYFDQAGRVTLDKPEVVAVGEYIVSLFEHGYVYEAEPWEDDWIDAVTDGRAATIVGASWYDNVLPIWLDPDSLGEWAVAPMPRWSETDTYRSANDGGSNLAINAHSHHPDEAWQFVEFMLGKEQSQLTMMKEGGFFPSLETTYDDPIFFEPIEYYGGQAARAQFVDAVRSIHPQAYTADYPLANELTAEAFARIFLNEEPVERVFRETADDLRARTGRP